MVMIINRKSSIKCYWQIFHKVKNSMQFEHILGDHVQGSNEKLYVNYYTKIETEPTKQKQVFSARKHRPKEKKGNDSKINYKISDVEAKGT